MGNLQRDENTSANTRLAQWEVMCKVEALCFYQALCYVDSSVLRNPHCAKRQTVEICNDSVPSASSLHGSIQGFLSVVQSAVILG